MGIRSTSYWGWQTVETFDRQFGPGVFVSSSYTDIAADSSGNLYACGWYYATGSAISDIKKQSAWLVKKSTDKGNSWNILFESSSVDNKISAFAIGILTSSDQIFLAGQNGNNVSIRSSSDYGINWGLHNSAKSVSLPILMEIAFSSNSSILLASSLSVHSSSDLGNTWGTTVIDTAEPDYITKNLASDWQGNVYAISYDGVGINSRIYKSNNSGSTWSAVYNNTKIDNNASFIKIDKNNNIVSIFRNNTGVHEGMIVSSSNGSTWGSASFSKSIFFGIAFASGNIPYVFGYSGSAEDNSSKLLTKKCAFAGLMPALSWSNPIDLLNFGRFNRSYIDKDDNIFIVGQQNDKGIIRRGRLTANSASLGPRMLSPTIGYVFSESIINNQTVMDERFKLNNISEFPHSEGIFQMKNMVLGTVDSGRVGKTDDSIIQVNYIGSFVKILWPRQDQDIFIQGYGDFAAGQKPGKLTTEWQSGEFIDVSKDKFDHVALYGYGLKVISGTMDSILLRIERRPLRNVGFTIEKAVEHTISGSYVESIYRDQIHRLDIDYGDLSIKEITWPIDVPLENVKELRISTRLKNGQNDDKNSSFVIYGRFIRSKEEV